MSEDKDNENEFERDFSEGTEEETTLNDETSALIEEDILETDSQTLTNGSETLEKEIDPIAEANESLITMNSAPFDQTLEIMSQTLASIDAKMDIENPQLQKLDQLSEIKDQLNRLENNSLATATTDIAPETQITTETQEDTEENMPQNSIGHNQQEISELLEKINNLESKIQAIENQSNNSNERFEKIESIVERFEDLESEIQIEYEEEEKPSLFKNLFKKKEKIKLYKNDNEITLPEMSLTEIKKDIPKNTESFIEEAEANLEAKNNEIIINGDNDDKIVNETNPKIKKNKLKNILLSILLILIIGITTIFILDGFRIIDSNFPIKSVSFSGWVSLIKNIF